MYRKMTGCGRTPEDASAASRHVIRTMLLRPARLGALSAGPDGTEACLPPGIMPVRTPRRGHISWSTGFPGPSGVLAGAIVALTIIGCMLVLPDLRGGDPCPPARYNRCEPPLTVPDGRVRLTSRLDRRAGGGTRAATSCSACWACCPTSPDLFPPSSRLPSLPRSLTGSPPGGPDLEDPWR
jgi:hypothetical protein